MNSVFFPTDYGRPDLVAKGCIFSARKKTGEPWDNSDPDIAYARACFEKGTHTLATLYRGAHAVLCLIPLKRADPKPGYFKLRTE